jgi:hypothetical protein
MSQLTHFFSNLVCICARFSHLIAQLCVTFAQFQRYLHIPALLAIDGVHVLLAYPIDFVRCFLGAVLV